ncbi:sensor histidine kinase [Candidatus Magnetomorum sp. HK-1]|nr:sensor histidine kinase [Candidatus Magnetomorum sp. HK-1]
MQFYFSFILLWGVLLSAIFPLAINAEPLLSIDNANKQNSSYQLDEDADFSDVLSQEQAHYFLIDEHTRKLPLTDHLSYFIDKKHQWSIHDVCCPPVSMQFKPLKQHIANLGFSDGTYWFKFRLRYQPRTVFVLKEFFLEIGYPLLDEVILYFPVQDGDYIVKKSGRNMWKSPSDIHYKHPIFRLYTRPFQDYEIIVKIRSSSTIQVPLTLWSPGAFSHNVGRENFIWGVFFGILIVMALYNAFIYLVVKDRSYLYYVCYIICFLCLLLSFNVSGFFQLPVSFTWWGHGSIPFFICFAGFWMTRFSKHFLRTKVFSPFRGKLLDFIIAGNAIIALASFVIPYYISVKLAAFYILINAIVLLFSGIVCYLNNGEQAKYYLIAWVALLTGIIMYCLKTFGILPTNNITNYGLPIGANLEVILLSFGLADRINTERREKIVAQKEALKAKSLSLVSQEKINVELQKAGTVKSNIISNISNEVRTPLHAMMGMVNLIKKTNLTKSQKRFIMEIKKAGEGLFQITNDLVDYARLESHRLKLSMTVFDLKKCINTSCDLFQAVARKKQIKLECMISNNLPFAVTGDQSRIRQVISNLLENAFKYTEKGEVVLQVQTWDDQMNSAHELNLKPTEPGECLIYFSVKDTGIGIESETQAELFNLFTKKDTENIGNQAGFGLGLSICKRLVQLMKGTIWVKSVPGKGSAFHFVIALKQSDPKLLEKKKVIKKSKGSLNKESLPALKILLAEDNPHNQLVIKMMFEDSPFTLDIVENGKQAVLKNSAKEYDLIIMDILMPMMNGIEAIEQIRSLEKQKKKPQLPILVITADGRPQTQKACKKAGCSAFMNKPIMDQDKLFEQIISLHKQMK